MNADLLTTDTCLICLGNSFLRRLDRGTVWYYCRGCDTEWGRDQ